MELSPHISTHVLDTSRGIPVAQLPVSLYRNVDSVWILVSESITTSKGRCNDFLEIAGQTLSVGLYKLVFDVQKYFIQIGTTSLYPEIQVIIDIKNSTEHYHIPLLLNPYGFSTYRGT